MPNGLSGLSTLAAFVAFILSALCLFAGTKTSILVDTDILTVRGQTKSKTDQDLTDQWLAYSYIPLMSEMTWESPTFIQYMS